MEILIQIKDIGKIITGKTPPTDETENFDGKYPFITPTDIKTFDEKYLVDTERTISDVGAKKLKNLKLPVNTICFVCIGSTIGKMCLTNKISFSNQQINSLITNENYDANYIFYLLRFIKGYFQQLGAGTGSGKGIVNKTTFEKTKIPVINNKVTQKKIADILSAYDNLIENNNKRIKLMEQMAENLYKEWFVRFRFPGYENAEHKNSVLGSIPKNFNVAKIGDVIEYYIGGGWGNDNETSEYSEEAYVIRGTDFPRVKSGNLSTCQLRYHKASNFKARKFLAEDIAFEVSGGTQEQPVGRSILISQRKLNRFNNRLICASFCKQIRCDKNKIVPLYMYYWLQYMYETRMLDKFQLQSTGITNFKFEYFLRKGNILIPPINLMDRFENNVRKFHDEIDFLSEQNDNLIRQRDLLLPRLMSGKLEV